MNYNFFFWLDHLSHIIENMKINKNMIKYILFSYILKVYILCVNLDIYKNCTKQFRDIVRFYINIKMIGDFNPSIDFRHCFENWTGPIGWIGNRSGVWSVQPQKPTDFRTGENRLNRWPKPVLKRNFCFSIFFWNFYFQIIKNYIF